MATLLIAEIQKKYHVLIELGDVFFDSSFQSILGYIRDGDVLTEITQTKSSSKCICSLNQKSLYVLNYQYKNIKKTYNIPIITKIDGVLDLRRFQNACETVFKTQEMLRTRFLLEGNEIYQVVAEDAELPFRILDISYDEFINNLDQYICPFNLEKDILIQIIVLNDVAKSEQHVFINQHHIISDGVSVNILLGLIADAYSGKVIENNFSYRDYAANQRKMLDEGNMEKSRQYWMKQLSNVNYDLDFPTDKIRPDIKSFAGVREIYDVDQTLIEQLEELALSLGTTLNTVMFSAYAVLIGRLSQKDEFEIGTTSSGRELQSTMKMLGIFINTLPILFQFHSDSTFVSVVESLKENLRDAYKHQRYPYSEIIDDLGLAGNLRKAPMIDAGFLFQNMDNEYIELDDNTFFRPYFYLGQGTRFEFMLEVNKIEGQTKLIMEYSTDLYEQASMKRIVDSYQLILSQIVKNPNELIKKLNIVTADELKCISERFNVTADMPFRMLADLFYLNTREKQEEIAVIMLDRQMTYGELNEKSNQIAYYLSEKYQANDVIAVKMKRDENLLISYLAVLKAGCTFMPIEPETPIEKMKYMCDISEAKEVLTNCKGHNSLGEIETDVMQIYELCNNKSNVCKSVSPDNAAYILFTSGSTGASKGVVIPYKALYNFAVSMNEILGLTDNNTVLGLTTISFDISMLELVIPMLFGKRIALVSDEEQLQHKKIYELMKKAEVDLVQMTPSRLKLFLMDKVNDFASVKKILIGGEMLLSEDIETLKSKTDAEIYNMYGPTETTIWSSVKKINQTSEITAGKPILNTRLLILDDNKKILPIGIPGELYIGGQGLATGYLKNDAETESKFIYYDSPEIGISKERLYKTGDMAKLTKNGEVIILGRNDNQIKLNGYRIEVDDIRDCILQIPEIKNAVVLCVEDHLNVKHLNCYYMASRQMPKEDINNQLKKRLPLYLMPTHYFYLEEFPLNANGKTDFNALKALNPAEYTDNLVLEENLTELQQKIKDLWCEILEVEDIGLNDNFYDMGGNSLLAIRFMVELEDLELIEYNMEIDVYTYNTIKKISKYLEELK